MHKVISALKWFFSNFFFLTIVVGVVQYVWWFRLSPPIPDHQIGTVDYVEGLTLLVFYAFFVWMFRRAKHHKILRTLLFFPTILFMGINGLFAFRFMPELKSSIDCNGISYYFTVVWPPESFDWAYYQLTKWNGPFKYEAFSKGYVNYALDDAPTQITCDQKTGDVVFFNKQNTLLFHDGTQHYNYGWSWGVTTNNYQYDIYLYDLYDTRRFIVSVCHGETVDTCQIQQLEHTSPTAWDEQASLLLDTQTRQVYVLFDGRIDSVYGDSTRKFETLSSVVADADNSRTQYSIATYLHNNAYVYVLYGCDAINGDDQFTGCYDLPFFYSTPGRETASLVIDKAADQLNVTVGDRLIFTYKGVYSGPYCDSGCLDTRCYIDHCTIPSPSP